MASLISRPCGYKANTPHTEQLVPRPSESEEGLGNIVHHHMEALVLEAKPLKLLAGLQ